MHLGIPLAELDGRVGPINRQYHVIAETMRLQKQGIVPLEPEDDDKPDVSLEDDPLANSRKQIRTAPNRND